MKSIPLVLTFAVAGGLPAVAATPSPQEIQDAIHWIDTYFAETPAAPAAFSFTCDGAPAQLAQNWTRTYTQESLAPGVERRVLVLNDARTGIELTYTAVFYREHAAIELLLELRNTGAGDSPLLEQIRALDCAFAVDGARCTLHHALGESNSARSFMPVADALDFEKNTSLAIAPRGGRSSDEHMPFFNVQWPGGGVVVAIGWAGQWEARFQCQHDKGLRVDCGMQKTRLRLDPGERIRTPRVLLQFWRGDDDLRANNLFRQWMLAHNLPRRNGELVLAPICGSVTEVDPDGSYEGPHVRAMKPLAERGVEVFWSDMDPQQWYPGGFPHGTGTWEPDLAKYPHGLRPIGEAAHAAGLKYLLWFEPERVAPGTRIEELHPAWIAKGQPFHLFRLDIAEAREWITDYIDKQITEANLNWLRWDFNIEPLGYWQRTDEPEREGITEIRHVEALYAMWEDLMQRHPGLVIDICASGGRRIDFETLRYGLPLWHSDSQCFGANPVTDQLQNGALFRWVPLHGCGNFALEPSYLFRSGMTTGNILCTNPSSPDPQVEAGVRRSAALYQKVRPFMLGDFYPLFAHVAHDDVWYGFQFHRPDVDAGFAVVFRRAQAPYVSAELRLQALSPDTQYTVTFEDRTESAEASGSELAGYVVRISEAPGSAILYYHAK
ncbi:MAG: alpha-galactosidase [Candidatus Hydrogenedentes bacterium]|nr:alpha-galactosidase [Candidatus Hydrogenedentota bacterium]